MKSKHLLFIIIALPLYFMSCKKTPTDTPDEDLLVCTLIFVTESVTVSGTVLDDFYSLRLSTGDTLRLEDYNSKDQYYPILDDSSIPQTKNIEERIDFVALRGDQILKTPYTFTSDGCHIVKKSGLEVINF